MNIDQVEELGRSLKDRAGDIERLVTDIDAKLRSTTWAGPDADRFRHEWWPKHKVRLHTTSQEIAGLGQSALNNAEAQRSASGTAGSAGSGGGSSVLPESSGNVAPHRPSWHDAWSQLKTVPVVGTVIEVGEFIGDVGNAGGVLAYEVHTKLKFGVGSPEDQFATTMSEEAMHRFNRGAVDVGWSAGSLIVAPLKAISVVLDPIARYTTALDGIGGSDVSKYTNPGYWLDSVLP